MVILLAGYAGAAMIWRAQDRLDAEKASLEANGMDSGSPLDSRRGTQQLENQFGKMGLLMESTGEFVSKWTHGRPLARVLIVLSSASAVGCFFFAGRRRY